MNNVVARISASTLCLCTLAPCMNLHHKYLFLSPAVGCFSWPAWYIGSWTIIILNILSALALPLIYDSIRGQGAMQGCACPFRVGAVPFSSGVGAVCL